MSVKIYMTNWCPYCRSAKTLLNNKGVSYEELNIDELGMTRNDLYDLTGGRTVPQIIINENSIGGFDDLFDEAVRLVVMHQQGSISLIQRRLKVGYSRAARLIDEMEQAGIVGTFTGSKAREVLVDDSYLDSLD